MTGHGSWKEPSPSCWDNSQSAVSCSFSGESPTCSWAKLRIFSTNAVSLGRKGDGWRQPGLSGDLACGFVLSGGPEQSPQPHQVLLSLCNHAPKEPSFFRNCWIRMWPGKEEVPGFLPSCLLSVPGLYSQRSPPQLRSLGSWLPFMPSLALVPAFPEPRTFLDQIHSMVLCLRGQFAPLLCPVQVVGSSQGRGQIDHGLFCAAPGKPQERGHASWG